MNLLRSNRRGWRLALFALALLASSLSFWTTPASAATLTNISWSVSNNQVSATSVTYTYSFRTATAGTIGKITFAVSGAGLGGTPTISRNYGIGAGTVARVGQTITYLVSTPVSVSAGIPIYLEFGGNTNSATTGSYTTAITTQTAASATIDTGTTPAVTLSSNNTAVTVTLAKSLTFTVDTSAFELDMDPSLPALADQTYSVGLTVQTNANSGYTLSDRSPKQLDRQPGHCRRLGREEHLDNMAWCASFRLHRNRHRSDHRRRVHGLEVRWVYVWGRADCESSRVYRRLCRHDCHR